MTFVWDANKDRINRRKHGVAFETAARVFFDPSAVSYVDRVVDGSTTLAYDRHCGRIILLLVVHTSEDRYGEEEIRIISARKASPRERDLYDAHQ